MNEGLQRIHPPPPLTKPNNARILHLCAAIQFIHCCRSVMEGGVSGNCWTLDTYILYQIPHIQSAVFTAHFNLNSSPSTIKKVCKAKPCWSITLFWVTCYLFVGGIWWRIWITKTKNRRSLFIVIVMQWLSWLFHQLCQPRKCTNYMDKETKCSYSIYILRTEDNSSYCYIDNDTYFVNCKLYCLLVLNS